MTCLVCGKRPEPGEAYYPLSPTGPRIHVACSHSGVGAVLLDLGRQLSEALHELDTLREAALAVDEYFQGIETGGLHCNGCGATWNGPERIHRNGCVAIRLRAALTLELSEVDPA